MKYQLIMLPEPILVSDEMPDSGDWCLNPDNRPEMFGYDYRAIYTTEQILTCKKIIAGISELPSIDFSGLTEEECKKIRWVDIQTIISPILNKKAETNNSIDLDAYALGLIDGFKTSQSLNDKKFSLEDVRTMFGLGAANNHNGNPSFEEAIQSISQPKVFDVEIGLEQLCHQTGLPCGFPCNGEDNCKKSLYPKITNNSIKIIKVL